MHKGNVNFKEIRKKVIHYENNQNNQNLPINPTQKVSFRGIKRNQENQSNIKILQIKQQEYLSPRKINTLNTPRSRIIDSNKQDCNKFSVLLQSKGYSNCNSARKKSTQVSFRNLIANPNTSSKTRLNTERIQKTQKIQKTFATQSDQNKADLIQRKCRQIKEKQYFSSRQNLGQLNSLNKLKNKLISPLKKKAQSQPELIKQPEKVINIFEHSSILSQHDLVNMSKTNQSIDFDMSPWL